MRHVQADHRAACGAGCGHALAKRGLNGSSGARKHHDGQRGADIAALRTRQGDGGIGIVGLLHRYPLRRRAVPARHGLLHHRRDRRQCRCFVRRLDARRASREFGRECLLVALVDSLDAPRHVHEQECHQARIGDHQMEWQRQHRQGVVPIEPGARALARTEREEVREDAPMRDHAADDRHEHEHRADANDPACLDRGHVVQVEMQPIEEFATTRIARAGNRHTRAGIERA